MLRPSNVLDACWPLGCLPSFLASVNHELGRSKSRQVKQRGCEDDTFGGASLRAGGGTAFVHAMVKQLEPRRVQRVWMFENCRKFPFCLGPPQIKVFPCSRAIASHSPHAGVGYRRIQPSNQHWPRQLPCPNSPTRGRVEVALTFTYPPWPISQGKETHTSTSPTG